MLARDCRALIAQYRRDLEVQLQQQAVRQEIECLRETYPVFEKYPSVEELAALVRPGNPAYADKDGVLIALLAEVKHGAATEQGPRLFPLLNVVFWDSLMSIFWRKRKSVPDPDELFSRVQADFCHTALTYPLDRRPRKININLYRDTWKKVTAWQQEEAKHREPCRPPGPTDDVLVDPREAEVHPKDMEVYPKVKPLGPADEAHIILGDPREAEVYPEDMESYLLGFVYQKVINETQYDLLLETAVYRRLTEKEWAKARGVKYPTARSWRHRAEQSIREYEKGRHKSVG